MERDTKKLLNWYDSLKTLSKEEIEDLKAGIGESRYHAIVTIGPLKGLLVDITTFEDKKLVVFYRDHITKVMYPESVKMYFQDYDQGKRMFVATFDDKLWFYHEILPDMPYEFASTVNIGLDMSMPFLSQFPVKEVTF